MKMTDGILEMLEIDSYGKNDFERIIKHSKNPIERYRAKKDYKLCQKLTYRNREGKLVMQSGMTVPIMTLLRSREVMRNIICWMELMSE